MKMFLERLQLHITSDKRLRYVSPKLPSATSFIRKTLGEMFTSWCKYKDKHLGVNEMKLGLV